MVQRIPRMVAAIIVGSLSRIAAPGNCICGAANVVAGLFGDLRVRPRRPHHWAPARSVAPGGATPRRSSHARAAYALGPGRVPAIRSMFARGILQ